MHYVVIVMGACMAFLFWAYTEAIEGRVEARIAAVQAQTVSEHKDEVATINKAHLAELAAERQERTELTGRYQDEIREWRDKAERNAREDPKTFGDDFSIRLARIMCRVQAGSDSSDREVCDNSPDEAFTSEVAATITVTPEIAETYQELCEDGQRDFCDWSITGFTPQWGERILIYLTLLDQYGHDQSITYNRLVELIEDINRKEPQ